MSKETEKIFRDLEKYLSGKEINNDIEYPKAVNEFMNMHKREKNKFKFECDSYDAMSRERPYRSALREKTVMKEIKKNAGYQFDPIIARIFLEKVLQTPWDN